MTNKDGGEPANSSTNETRELTVSRVIQAEEERVYQAFINPDELAEWLHPTGFSTEIQHLEPEEGGTYRIAMTGETEDLGDYGHSYGGTFLELVPGERIVQREVFESEEGGLAGEMTVTTTFEDDPDGTDVTVRLEIPVDWPDGAIGGWKDALENLAGLLSDG